MVSVLGEACPPDPLIVVKTGASHSGFLVFKATETLITKSSDFQPIFKVSCSHRPLENSAPVEDV